MTNCSHGFRLLGIFVRVSFGLPASADRQNDSSEYAGDPVDELPAQYRAVFDQMDPERQEELREALGEALSESASEMPGLLDDAEEELGGEEIETALEPMVQDMEEERRAEICEGWRLQLADARKTDTSDDAGQLEGRQQAANLFGLKTMMAQFGCND